MGETVNMADTSLAGPAGGDGMITLRSDDLSRNDPVYKLLFRSQFRAALTISLNVLLAGIVFFVGASLNGGLFNKDYAIDPAGCYINFSTARLFDVTTSLRKMLLIPLGLTVYFLLPRWIANLFNNLKGNGVISHPRDGSPAYGKLVSSLSELMGRRDWAILGVITVAVFYCWRLKGFDHGKRPLYLEIAALITYGLVFYCFLPTLGRLCVAVFFTNRLFNSFNIRVNPLHPDDAGGIGPVGRLFSTCVMIFAIFGILAAAGIVSSYMRESGKIFGRAETQMLVGGYAVIPLLVWGWLWTPHKAMLEDRDRKLLVVAQEFLRATPDEAVDTRNSLNTSEDTERLGELKKQYEVLRESYPTWPLRFRQANRLAALASTPLITTALPATKEYLVGFLTSKL